MADPFTAFFAAVGSSIGGTAGAFLIMNAQALAYASLVVGSIATGNYQKRKMEQRARDAYNASLEDRKVMIRSGTAPSPVVYGETRLSGPIVHAQSTGDKEQYLHLVVAFTRHELNAFKTIYFGDVALPQENGTTGLVESGQFAYNENPDKAVTVTTNGSGVATLPDVATKVFSATNGQIFSFDSGYTAYSFSHTPPSSTVTGLPPNTQVTISYEYGVATPKVKIRRHLGGAGQVADADLVADSGGLWTSNDVGVGVAYLYVRLEWHNEVFGQVGVPNISAIVQGKKVYDPRSTLTVYSNNAALCTADYLKDTRFGIRATSTEVPNSEVIVAANICDEDVVLYNTGTVSVVNGAAAVIGSGTSWLSRVRPGYTFIGPNAVRYTVASVLTNALLNLTTNYGGTTQSGQAYSVVQPRYTVNGALGSDVSPMDNLNHLVSAMAGTAVFVQGRWLVRAGAHITPVLTIDADALGPGSVTILPRRGRADLFNGVWGKFFDRDTLYAENEYPVVTSSAYQSEDGEQVLIQMDYPLVDDAIRCVRLSTVELNRSRQALTVQLTANYRAYDLVPSDTVYVTLSKYGFSSKQFIVLDRALDLAPGLIKYVLRETASVIWDWTFTAVAGVDPAPNTDLPSWSTPPPEITGLAVDSGTSQLIRLTDGTVVSRAKVSWTAPNDQFVLKGGWIEVKWKLAIQDTWESAGTVPGDQTSIYLSPVPDGRPITVAVRAISSSDRRGLWTYLTVQVVGKTALPSDVSGLTITKTISGLSITWSDCPDLDYDVTVLKIGASWGAGTLLTGFKGNRFEWPNPAVGAYTVWAKHFDTSGNESSTAASASYTVNVGDFAAGGGNLLKNSSFEIDTNIDGVPDDWVIYENGNTGSVTRALSPSEAAPFGTMAQSVSAAALGTASTDRAGLYQLVPVASLLGAKFHFSVYAKSTSGTARVHLYIDYLNNGSFVSSGAGADAALTTTWARFASGVEEIPAAGITHAALYVSMQQRSGGAGAASFVFDGAQMELGEALSGYSPGVYDTENTYQQIGQNLIPNSDWNSSILPATFSVANGATYEQPYLRLAAENGWTVANYVLVAGTTRNVFLRQTSRIAGADNQVVGYVFPLGITGASTVRVPVVAGQRYMFSAYVNCHRCQWSLAIEWYDSSNALIRQDTSGDLDSPRSLSNTLAGYNRGFIAGIAPANAVQAFVFIRKHNTEAATPTDSYMWIAAPQFEAVAPNATGPSPYVPGPVRSTADVGTPSASLTLVNVANCQIIGDQIQKTAAGGAWDAGVRSVERYLGGAVAQVTCPPNVVLMNWMFGLNDNDATSSYTDLNFAIQNANGTLAAYEEGSLVANNIGSCTDGDVLSVRYDGRTVSYLKNGAVLYEHGATNFNHLFFDCSLYSLGARINAPRLYPVQRNTDRNLLDPRTWVYGSTGSQPGFPENACSSGGSNFITIDTLPSGDRGVLWRADSGTATSGNAEGGFNTSATVPIDHTRMYRFSVWIRCFNYPSGTRSGSFYFGPDESTVNDIAGGLNSNPYFVSGNRSALNGDEWYLLVGYVWPSNYSGAQQNTGGVYRGKDGAKVAGITGVDFRWPTGQAMSGIRAYQYYTTNQNDFQDFWNPRMELADGTEPSLRELLAVGAVSGGNPITSANFGQFTDSGAFTEVLNSTPGSATTITTSRGAPNTYSRFTLVGQVTYTPTQNCDAICTFNGTTTYTDTSTFLNGCSVTVQDYNQAIDLWKVVMMVVPANATLYQQGFVVTRRFSLVAGQTYDFRALAQKHGGAGDTMTVENCELRVEIVKR